MPPANSLKTIVVPTDFSAGARRALQRVALLPLAARAEVHVVHVVDERWLKPSPDKQQRAMEQVQSVLSGFRQEAGSSAPRISARILTGTAHVEIIRYARSIEADLVVLGRKGAGYRIGQVLGRTAARVAQRCDLPVLVVGPPPRGPYQHPLLALELDSSLRALVKLVREVTGRRSKSIAAVHAYHVPFEGLISPGSETRPSQYHQQIRDDAQRRLDSFLKTMRIRGIGLKVALRRGDPPGVILRQAWRERADLIALGTHGRVGIAHAMIGSVAESVVVGATRDVLIARPVRFTFDVE